MFVHFIVTTCLLIKFSVCHLFTDKTSESNIHWETILHLASNSQTICIWGFCFVLFGKLLDILDSVLLTKFTAPSPHKLFYRIKRSSSLFVIGSHLEYTVDQK